MEFYYSIAEQLYKVLTMPTYQTYFYYPNEEWFNESKHSYAIDYGDTVDYRGKPSVYGCHLLKKDTYTLVITQGEESCIALYVTDTIDVVGSPKIDNFDWLANSMKLINEYKKVVLLGDNDWQLEVYRRLHDTHEVLTINKNAYNEHRNVFECLASNCMGDIVKALENPISLQIEGILTVDDLEFVDWESIERIYTGFNDIDSKSLGLPMGMTSLWSGSTGMGKTTVVNKLVLNAVQQSYRCCIYSGEMSASRVYTDIGTQAANKNDISYIPVKLWDGTPSGEYFSKVSIEAQYRFRQWTKGRIYVKNNDYTKKNEADNIISIFENAFKMHNCRLFIVDNLMSILAHNVSENQNEMQTYLMNRLVEFAVRCNVHVVIVAHFRKTKAGEKTGNNDVAGSSNVPNMAGAVYSIEKFDEDKQKKVNEYCEKEHKEVYTGMIKCTKNRATGKLYKIPTRWDNDTRQVYGFGDRIVKYGMYDKQYDLVELSDNDWK